MMDGDGDGDGAKIIFAPGAGTDSPPKSSILTGSCSLPVLLGTWELYRGLDVELF